MKFNLTQIDAVESINKEDFEKNYLIPRKPLIIEKMEHGIYEASNRRQKAAKIYLYKFFIFERLNLHS